LQTFQIIIPFDVCQNSYIIVDDLIWSHAMKLKLTAIPVLFLSLCLSINVNAQKFKIKNYSFGYRIFELSPVGNNPITISPILKNPEAYTDYLNSIPYNGFSGNTAPFRLHTFYLNAEFSKSGTSSRFWKTHTLQAGFVITGKLTTDAGSVENRYHPGDTMMVIDKYSLTKNQQFFGVNFGLNHRFKISGKLQFLAGVHAQGSFALVNNYDQRWDSSIYLPNGRGSLTKTTVLPALKGKNFFQWQLMFPLGIEYDLYHKQLFVRIEFNPGIVGGPYRPKSFASRETYGAGIWFVYQRR